MESLQKSTKVANFFLHTSVKLLVEKLTCLLGSNSEI